MRNLIFLGALTFASHIGCTQDPPDPDNDGDGFTEGEDCDDNNDAIHPYATEVCDGIDNDCDGDIDDADSVVDPNGFDVFYPDLDGDGFGDETLGTTLEACVAPTGWAAAPGDCDDSDPLVHPESIWYVDSDQDGYGRNGSEFQGCEKPFSELSTLTGGDCDDDDALIYPGAVEICDGLVDNDCDGLADDADSDVDPSTYSEFYVDADNDGYGEPSASVFQCDVPSGYSVYDSDCDDDEFKVNPGRVEVCNDGLDNDCSGDAPECGLPVVGTEDHSCAGVSAGTGGWRFGGSEMTVGDFDGDGYNDLAVSDSYGNTGASGQQQNGVVHLLYGPISTTGTLAQGRLIGSNTFDHLGASLANIGDWSGDGVDDLLIGATHYNVTGDDDGKVYWASGTTSDVDIDSHAFLAQEGTLFQGYLGSEVANLGDIDGSGDDTIAIGSYGFRQGGQLRGRVYLMNQSQTVNLTITGEPDDDIGYSQRMTGTGDLNGDGYDDWAASGAEPTWTDGGLEVWLYYGKPSPNWTGTGDADVTLSSQSSTTDFGKQLVGPGDLDDDGYADLILFHDDVVNIFTGSSAHLSPSASPDIIFEDGSNPEEFQSLAIGDLNNDGSDDLIVSTSDTEKVLSYFGPLSSGTYDVSTADSTLTSTTQTGFGSTVATGDVTGDGKDALMSGYFGSNKVLLFNCGAM
jgi:hypothetical protein